MILCGWIDYRVTIYKSTIHKLPKLVYFTFKRILIDKLNYRIK